MRAGDRARLPDSLPSPCHEHPAYISAFAIRLMKHAMPRRLNWCELRKMFRLTPRKHRCTHHHGQNTT
jgi:hypothetical protein